MEFIPEAVDSGASAQPWGAQGSAPFVSLGQHTPLYDPPPPHPPLLDSVLGMPRPTYRRIPKEARPAFTGALAAVISAFVASPPQEAL